MVEHFKCFSVTSKIFTRASDSFMFCSPTLNTSVNLSYHTKQTWTNQEKAQVTSGMFMHDTSDWISGTGFTPSPSKVLYNNLNLCFIEDDLILKERHRNTD